MERGRLERLAPLAGVLFFILIVVAIVVFPDEIPDADDPRAKVVAFWLKNDSEATASAFIFALAVIPLIWFAGALRSRLREAEGGTGRLSAVSFGAALVLAAGFGIAAAVQLALGDAADSLSPDAIQALNALNADIFLVFAPAGATWMLANALVIIRHRPIHVAWGWIALVIGIASATPAGFFGFLAAILWVGVVSIVLFLRQPEATPPPAAASPA